VVRAVEGNQMEYLFPKTVEFEFRRGKLYDQCLPIRLHPNGLAVASYRQSK
jgi:hypothetical protein